MATINTTSIPPRISARIQGLIIQRDAKRAERRELKEYTGYDDFYKRQNQADRVTLDSAITELESQIVETARKYMNGMAVIVDKDVESTIANILTALPNDSGVKMATFVNARMQSVP